MSDDRIEPRYAPIVPDWISDQVAIERLEHQIETLGVDWQLINELKEEVQEIKHRVDDLTPIIDKLLAGRNT